MYRLLSIFALIFAFGALTALPVKAAHPATVSAPAATALCDAVEMVTVGLVKHCSKKAKGLTADCQIKATVSQCRVVLPISPPPTLLALEAQNFADLDWPQELFRPPRDRA